MIKAKAWITSNTTNQLFLENPHVRYWRFEVVFTFTTEMSSSALNFVVNQPPSNGSCSIFPLQGTTSTLFTVSCPGWFDEDGIKDYALTGYIADQDDQTMLAFSAVSDFTIRLPSSDVNRTQLKLIVIVRDTLDCVVSVNLSMVTVIVDTSAISQLVNQLYNSTDTLTSDPLVRLLSSGNQNTVAQLVTSLSQYFNQIDRQNIDDALSSKLSDLNDSLYAPSSFPCRWYSFRQYFCFLIGKHFVSTSNVCTDECISLGRFQSQAESVCQCA